MSFMNPSFLFFWPSVFLVAFSTWPGVNVNSINFNKLQTGMTLQEVKQLFGCEPGDYRHPSKPSFARSLADDIGSRHFGIGDETWISDFGRIGVSFDFNGKIRSWGFASVCRPEGLTSLETMQYNLLIDYFLTVSHYLEFIRFREVRHAGKTKGTRTFFMNKCPRPND